MVRSSMISIGAASEPSAAAARCRWPRWSCGRRSARAAADLAADHRRGDDLALALLEQQDGHALAHVLARDVAEDARALGVQRQVDGGPWVWLSKPAWASVRFSPVRMTLALRRSPPSRRARGSARCRRAPGRCRVAPRASARPDHAHLQRGGAADDVLGLGGVLHAGQLHDDAVQPLLLDHRLGHAEFVDAVVQRGDVLPATACSCVLRASGLSTPESLNSAPSGAVGPGQVGQLVGQQVARAGQRLAVAEADVDAVAARDAGVAQVLVAQRCGCRRSAPRRAWSAPPSCRPAGRKCTPPRRIQAQVHRQRDCSASQCGERDSRLSATM